MVPWFWFLIVFSDCRIFQNMTCRTSSKRSSRTAASPISNANLQGTYNPREYCVQYRETDFNFVSRLLEEEGIYYYFEHSAQTHQLMLADKASAFVACPDQATANVVR